MQRSTDDMAPGNHCAADSGVMELTARLSLVENNSPMSMRSLHFNQAILHATNSNLGGQFSPRSAHGVVVNL